MSGISYLIGVKTNDFVILAADTALFSHGMLLISHDHDKSFTLGERLMMLCIGEGGDIPQFGDFIAKNLELYKYKNGYEMGPKAAAHFTRRTIADSLRSQDHYLVDVLMGGYDVHEKAPYLAMIDYLGNRIDDCNYLFRGFSGKFCYSILDRIYRPEMTQAEVVDAVKLCLNEVKKRFVANNPGFQLYIIDKDGTRKLEKITV